MLLGAAGGIGGTYWTINQKLASERTRSIALKGELAKVQEAVKVAERDRDSFKDSLTKSEEAANKLQGELVKAQEAVKVAERDRDSYKDLLAKSKEAADELQGELVKVQEAVKVAERDRDSYKESVEKFKKTPGGPAVVSQNNEFEDTRKKEIAVLEELFSSMMLALVDGDRVAVRAERSFLRPLITHATRAIEGGRDGVLLFMFRAWASSGHDSKYVDADIGMVTKLGKMMAKAEERKPIVVLLDRIGQFEQATQLELVGVDGAEALVSAGADRAETLLEIAGNSPAGTQRTNAILAASAAADAAAGRGRTPGTQDVWRAVYLRGRAHELLGRLEEAIADYQKAESRAPGEQELARILAARARVRTAMSRKPSVTMRADAAIKPLRVGFVPGLRAGRVSTVFQVPSSSIGAPDDPLKAAKTDAMKAIELTKGEAAGPLFEFGSILLQEGNKPAALVYLLRAYVKTEPNGSGIVEGLEPKVILQRIRQAEECLPRELEQAAELLRRALNPEPSAITLDQLIKQLLDRLKDGKTEIAGPTVDSLCQLVQTIQSIWRRMGPSAQCEPNPGVEKVPNSVVGTRDSAFGTEALTRSVRLFETSPGRAYESGLTAFWSGDYRRAAIAFEEASKLAPDAATLYFLGLARERLGVDGSSAWSEAARVEHDQPQWSQDVGRQLIRIQGDERARLDAFRR